MTTANPYLALADALGALGATLRHHRDLGFTELPLEGGYLLSPEEALRAQEQALAGCRRCRLCEGRTTLVVAHRLHTIMHADRILVVEGGTVVETGRHDELLRKGGRYATFYRVQLKGPVPPREPVAAVALSG